MKLTVLQKDLNLALANTSRFTQNKAQLPILNNIIFEVKKNKLELRATNLEMSIVTSIGAKVDTDGRLAVPSRVIHDLVSNMPEGQISLKLDKESLIIESSSVRSVVSCMNASDFPEIPDKISKSSISLSLDDFKGIVGKAMSSISTDETRPTLTGMLFSFSKTNLTVVATDGFRLSRKVWATKSLANEDVVIPKNILTELLRSDAEKIDMSYAKNENQVVFSLGNSILSSRAISGDFPDYKRIIPSSSDFSLLVDTKDFLKAIKLASVFSRDSSNVVKIKTGKNKINIFSESKQSGKNEISVEAKPEGDWPSKSSLEIAFNYKFIEDFLNTVTSETVELGLTANDSPGVFLDPLDKDYLHLIMPVRI